MEKQCAFCGDTFTPDIRNRRKSKYCSGKDCRRKHWRKLNPEMDKAQQERVREKRKSDPERYAIHKLKGRVSNKTPDRRYLHCKRGAVVRKIQFFLTKEQFMTLWQKDCHYCGEKIDEIGIDRIDNSKGYSIENCVPCCIDCNKMKMTKTVEQFLRKCEIIVSRVQAYDTKAIR